MKRLFYVLMGITLISTGCSNQEKASDNNPMAIIMETDIGNDVDDAFAMDLLYKYLDKGEINLLAVNINKEGSAPSEFVDLLNTWYGHPEVPIGTIKDGADCEDDAVNYAKAVVEEKDEQGNPLYARTHSGDFPDAVNLYREILSKQKNNSVTIVSVGFSTNLVRLLASAPDEWSKMDGKTLVEKKVKTLVMMAGRFDKPGYSEYNVVKDIPAAKIIFEEWPTPVVTSPFEVGLAVPYPASSIENDFAWATQSHPVVDAYKAYKTMPYDRPMWDPTSVLYAVGGKGMFTVSPAGRINVSEKGETIFTPDPKGDRYYLSVTPEQADSVKAYFVNTITSKPLIFTK